MKETIASQPPTRAVLRKVTALAALGSILITNTIAQNDEGVYELQAFTVKGGTFSSSIAAATEKKKFNPTIVEAISAEDIGKLPDTSIAESLSRLPGMTSQRVNGRSQVISIRGFPAEFTAGMLNGRELATTSSNRDVEYDQYPGELLSGAIVYKTTQTSLANQGIGGTVDLRTVRPLSYGERTIATNAFYEWTELGALNAGSDEGGWRYSGTYIDQLNEGKTGIAFGYSHTSKPGQGEQWNSWGYPTVDSEEYGEVNIIGGAKPFVRSSLLERDSLMAVLENKPNDNIRSTVDLFYSDFAENQTLRGIEIPLFWSSADFVEGSEMVDDGLVTQGTFENIFGVMRNDVVDRDANVFTVGWNLEVANLGEWSADLDIAYSEVDRTDRVVETYSGTGSNQTGTPDTMSFSMEGGTGALFTPLIDYTDTSILRLSGPQGWGGDIVAGGQVGYFKEPETKDELTQIKLSTRRHLDSKFDSIEFGVRHTNRKKNEAEAGSFLSLSNGQAEAPFPDSIGVTDLSFIGIPGMASYNPLQLLNDGTYEIIVNPNADVVAVDWSVEEKITQAYAQVGFSSRAGETNITGSLGLQYVHSQQSSVGLAASGTGADVETVPVSNSHSYDDWVPSLNLTFMMPNEHYIRFSASRQIMRQRMSDMRAGFQFTYEPAKATSTDPLEGPWNGSGGNTELEPWRSNALDLSYEKYFKDGMGYWSIAGFYKDLRTFAYTEQVLKDFTGFPYTDEAPAIFEGKLDIPRNGKGGNVQGLEFTLSLPGEKFSEALKGFGTILNFAYTDSAIQPDPNNDSVSLNGFSQNVSSATLYYENKGFAARVSGRYRSEYRANVSTFGPRGEDFRMVQPETLIDAQIGYTFLGGNFEGVSLTLQAYNLNNEPLSTYEGGDTRLIRDYQSYGRSYSAGVSYKF